ncbi:hypothetical protein EC991_001528 [Linnemannia zychae]|nr:hypothetical protein EC991_001528 [Linnemannia zychae]
MALIIPSMVKRLREGFKVQVRILKAQQYAADQVVMASCTKLDIVLKSHRHGHLIRLEDYRPLDNMDPVWHIPFPDIRERLVTMFGRLLLHSSDDVLLTLKVEVYGAAEDEDPRAQDVAKLKGTSSFKVVNMYHDNTHSV